MAWHGRRLMRARWGPQINLPMRFHPPTGLRALASLLLLYLVILLLCREAGRGVREWQEPSVKPASKSPGTPP